MTRREGRNRLLHRVKSDDPLLLDDLLTEATDDVALATDAYFIEETFDLDGSVGTPFFKFCAPLIYKVKGWRYIDSSGVTQTGREWISPTGIGDLCPDWRTDDVTGDPVALVVERPNFYVYPRITWTVTAGVTISGFATPGRTWEAEGDLFPLPDFCWNVVMMRAVILHDTYNPTKESAVRLSGVEKAYARALGLLEGRLSEEWGNGR